MDVRYCVTAPRNQKLPDLGFAEIDYDTLSSNSMRSITLIERDIPVGHVFDFHKWNAYGWTVVWVKYGVDPKIIYHTMKEALVALEKFDATTDQDRFRADHYTPPVEQWGRNVFGRKNSEPGALPPPGQHSIQRMVDRIINFVDRPALPYNQVEFDFRTGDDRQIKIELLIDVDGIYLYTGVRKSIAAQFEPNLFGIDFLLSALAGLHEEDRLGLFMVTVSDFDLAANIRGQMHITYPDSTPVVIERFIVMLSQIEDQYLTQFEMDKAEFAGASNVNDEFAPGSEPGTVGVSWDNWQKFTWDDFMRIPTDARIDIERRNLGRVYNAKLSDFSRHSQNTIVEQDTDIIKYRIRTGGD